MPSPERSRKPLPKDLMEMQLGQVDLLLAMYAADDEMSMNDSSLQIVEQLRNWCEGSDETLPVIIGQSISLLLNLDISDTDDVSSSSPNSLQLDISVPIVLEEDESPAEPPKVKVRVRQPAWMSKAEASRLSEEIPDEDLLTIIEHVKDAASQYLVELRQRKEAASQQDSKEATIRVWFYFPSISTRAKRDDLINYAPAYGLTGFLLAGKPGVLCVEGGSQAIDDYMKFIKTESWGDIPSGHKKVSERYRESGSDVKRAFTDMQEITDLLGERRGERQNRNDMKALEAWLTENGVGEAFGKVLI